MYESPIKLVVQDIETQMVQKEEQTILEAIRKCGVVVDKNELIKAINYERNQYSKGYKDGVNDVVDKIRTEIENHCCLTKENHCRYCSYCNSLMGVREILAIIDKYKKESEE